jgi:CIC family chloride channel protein
MDGTDETKHQGPSLSWLRIGLELREKIRLGDKQVIYIWAFFVGVVGALTALLFEQAVHLVQTVLTWRVGLDQMEAFKVIPEWHRILVPTIGGLFAGFTLLFTHRFVPTKATEYMEAVALGDGYVPAKPSLLRSLSAVFTIGSGAAIGREGPLIQTSAVAASLIGRHCHLSAPRLRLIVACAAASGMAAAFHTPLSGGLFVGEIVLGALTIDFLAPLLVASCAGYLTTSYFQDPTPIYQVTGKITLGNDGMRIAVSCIVLGIVAALCAKGWLWLLKKSRSLLNGRRQWLPVRLALAGAMVGVIAIWFPEIVGNGRHMIRGLVNSSFTLDYAALLLCLKVMAVAIVFGVGTVGGALTPSLTIGAMIGFLFNFAMNWLGFPEDYAIAYSLVGMAAFFTTAANAPMTSLLLVIEFTLAGQLIFPLIIGVVVSSAFSRLMKVESMYHDSLALGPQSIFSKPLQDVFLKDIARKLPPTVEPNDNFGTVASTLLKNPSQTIFVASDTGKYMGAIMTSDIQAFANTKDEQLAYAVLARDVTRNNLPTLKPEMKLPEALDIFSKKGQAESLALVDSSSGHLDGVVNKTDLYLVLSEIMRREKIG